MRRKEAFALLKQKITNENLVKHCLAAEAAMSRLAAHFGEDSNQWALAGLLHDIDYEETKDSPEIHSRRGAEILKELGVDAGICQAVLTHNERHGLKPEGQLAKALYCVDPLTGLIVAATLVLPSKKITDLSAENVLNRFREKGFARGANREIISQCESLLNLSLEEFVEIVLSAMQAISTDLGL